MISRAEKQVHLPFLQNVTIYLNNIQTSDSVKDAPIERELTDFVLHNAFTSYQQIYTDKSLSITCVVSDSLNICSQITCFDKVPQNIILIYPERVCLDSKMN